MANNIPLPDISPAFIIEDIHKIREWTYERHKGMSRQEIIDDINAGAREFEVLIEEARQSMKKAVLPTSANVDRTHTARVGML